MGMIKDVLSIDEEVNSILNGKSTIVRVKSWRGGEVCHLWSSGKTFTGTNCIHKNGQDNYTRFRNYHKRKITCDYRDDMVKLKWYGAMNGVEDGGSAFLCLLCIVMVYMIGLKDPIQRSVVFQGITHTIVSTAASAGCKAFSGDLSSNLDELRSTNALY